MGLATARRLSQRHRVLIADLDAAKAAAAAATLRDEGADAEGMACDVTDPASVAALAERTRIEGGLRVLAHVAGLSPSMGDFAQIVRVNLHGPALVAAALLPHAYQGSAAIVVSSLAAHNFAPPATAIPVLRAPVEPMLAERLREAVGDDGATPQSAYQLSKYGLLMMCRREAHAWGERGARILSLSPGLIATPMGALEFEKSEGKRKLFEMSPLRRDGTLLEIADAVEFLASDRASFITGTDILVDGGLAGTLSDIP